jgi:hypothetical protein
VFHHILPVLPVSLICHTPIKFSQNQVQIAPSPATSIFRKRTKLLHCCDRMHPQSPHHTAFPIQSRGLFCIMIKSSSTNPAKLKTLIVIFLCSLKIQLKDAMILAKYSIEEIADVSFHHFLQRTLPGGSLKGLRSHISANAPLPPEPPDCTERRLHCANSNAIVDIKYSLPSINPAANHNQIVIASAIAQHKSNPVDVFDVGTLVLMSSRQAMANKLKQHNCFYYL